MSSPRWIRDPVHWHLIPYGWVLIFGRQYYNEDTDKLDQQPWVVFNVVAEDNRTTVGGRLQ